MTLIESVIGQLKNICHIEHTRHLSFTNQFCCSFACSIDCILPFTKQTIY